MRRVATSAKWRPRLRRGGSGSSVSVSASEESGEVGAVPKKPWGSATGPRFREEEGRDGAGRGSGGSWPDSSEKRLKRGAKGMDFGLEIGVGAGRKAGSSASLGMTEVGLGLTEAGLATTEVAAGADRRAASGALVWNDAG